jgi:hypothetical protein
LQAAALPTEQQWAEAFERERQGALRGATGPLTPALVLAELNRQAGMQLGLPPGQLLPPPCLLLRKASCLDA